MLSVYMASKATMCLRSVAPGENSLLRLEGAVSSFYIWARCVRTVPVGSFFGFLRANGFPGTHWFFLPNSVKSKKYETLNRSLGRAEHTSGTVYIYLREIRSKITL